MERIYGIPVSDIAALKAQGTNLKLLAERGVETFFTQVFRDSFFHADMHPGNVFVSYQHPEDPLWIGIDCGIVGTLNREDKRYLAENFLALIEITVKLHNFISTQAGFLKTLLSKNLNLLYVQYVNLFSKNLFQKYPSQRC